MTDKQIKLSEIDLHAHLKRRMAQRGITLPELEQAINFGWDAPSAKPGTMGKVLVIPYKAEWQGQLYDQKEVTVYYKLLDDETLILLTVLARYGYGFEKSR